MHYNSVLLFCARSNNKLVLSAVQKKEKFFSPIKHVLRYGGNIFPPFGGDQFVFGL